MADLNDLKREWDSQQEYSEKKMNKIAELVRSRSDSMRSRLFARDMTETIVGVFIIVVFGGFWFVAPALSAPNAIAKTGISIIIAGAVEIIVLMQIVQRRGRADFTSVALKDFLASEVQVMNRQVSLSRHVAWWYLLQLYTGACLFVIGLGASGDWNEQRTFCISFCVGYLIFCVFVWWLNQYARRTTLEPLRNAMQRTYDSLAAMDSGAPDPDADLVSALADPALDRKCGVGNWRLVRPSWFQVIVIILATLGGAYCGLRYPIHDMGPEFFQAVVGAIIAFEIALVCTILRRRSQKE